MHSGLLAGTRAMAVREKAYGPQVVEGPYRSRRYRRGDLCDSSISTCRRQAQDHSCDMIRTVGADLAHSRMCDAIRC
jgi:hypothetical protein